MKAEISQKSLKIGEVAHRSGLSIKTIRYYDNLGLLKPTVKRSPSGYRLFEPVVIKRLAFIKRSQSLGLSLADIQAIFEVYDQGNLPCDVVKQQLEEKVATLDTHIHALCELQTELKEILSGWQDPPDNATMSQSICPNLSATST